MNKKILDSKGSAVNYVSDLLIDAIKNNPSIVLGLATGSTFEDVYAEMARQIKNDKIDLSNVITFNLDEYVDLDKKHQNQSYVYYMNEHFFKWTNINRTNTHFPTDYEDDVALGKEFPEYDEKISIAGKIDIQILGIGRNGHIGFNEPGSSLNSITRCVKLTPSTIQANSRFFDSANDVPKLSVTMGISTIAKLTNKIILVVFGEEKREALQKLLDAKSYDANWPCTILYDYPDLTIVTDFKI